MADLHCPSCQPALYQCFMCGKHFCVNHAGTRTLEVSPTNYFGKPFHFDAMLCAHCENALKRDSHPEFPNAFLRIKEAKL